MTSDDWPDVAAIHREGIATGDSTFEAEPPSWQEFDSARLATPRLVALVDERIVGWAAASPVSTRSFFAGVVEHSIYVSAAARGTGVGTALLEAFLDASDAHGIWTVQAGIFPENEPSLALHRKLGFRLVGFRERLARMTYGPQAGAWRDVAMLERRSAVVHTTPHDDRAPRVGPQWLFG